ncbi:copper oxidase [Methylomonas paludis]|uniref:Copper oxidase n=1 Tax=Methylomonas paludis TaxID=1173101 RepID=A0A975R8P4_9GAMM|nr:copper oxidase [Methylomonas paludis]QWF70625.1 copper oxidase [Methylomonas paludis]
MDKIVAIAVLISTLSVTQVSAKEFQDHTQMMSHGEGHLMDMDGGMVMGQNTDTLPGGCDSITATKEITVHAGHKYAEKFPGTMFAFDQQEYQFEPCTKLTVHFINDDEIRHQWMMHGLPKYLYPKGMFHLEVSGPGQVSGTLILPPGDKTYLVHCDIAQHMEKGMKGQLKVGKGGEDLPSIPGVTASVFPDDYSGKPYKPEIFPVSTPAPVAPAPAVTPAANTAAANADESFLSGTLVIGLALGLIVAPFLVKKYQGMAAGEIIADIVETVTHVIGVVIGAITKLVKQLTAKKSIPLPDK